MHGAFRRVGARIEPRFHLHDGAYQRRPDAIQTGIFNDDVVVRLHPIGDNRITRRPDAFGFGDGVGLYGIGVLRPRVREHQPPVGIPPAENLSVGRGGEANENEPRDECDTHPP